MNIILIEGAKVHEDGTCAWDHNCKSKNLLKVGNTSGDMNPWGLCVKHAKAYGGTVLGTLGLYASDDTEGEFW